jgi:hypothetical protein
MFDKPQIVEGKRGYQPSPGKVKTGDGYQPAKSGAKPAPNPPPKKP